MAIQIPDTIDEIRRPVTIDFLSALGDDQIKSQYALVFTGGIPIDRNDPPTRILTGITEVLTYRQQDSVDLPQRKVGTYDITYQGLVIKKVAPKDENSKEFNVTIRLDADGLVYAALDAWYTAIFNEWDGSIGSQWGLRTVIDLILYRTNKTASLHFRFYDALLVGFSGNSVDHGAAEPLTVEATFVYTRFDRFIRNSNNPLSTLLSGGARP